MNEQDYDPSPVEHWACPDHPRELLPIWLACPKCYLAKGIAAHNSAAAREQRADPRLQSYPDLEREMQANSERLRHEREAREKAFRTSLIKRNISVSAIWILSGIIGVLAIRWFLIAAVWLYEGGLR